MSDTADRKRRITKADCRSVLFNGRSVESDAAVTSLFHCSFVIGGDPRLWNPRAYAWVRRPIVITLLRNEVSIIGRAVELCGVPNWRIIGGTLRVRILQALAGVIEGHSLSQFVPGYVYDVPEAFGRQLIEMKAAVEVRATDPAIEPEGDDIDMARLTGGVQVVPQDKANDRPQLRPKPDRRKTPDRRRITRNERRS